MIIEKPLAWVIKQFARVSGYAPHLGFKIGNYSIDEYRGMKSGAVLMLFGYDADDDLCVLALKQKKWNADKPVYNFIEGFRNGPDLGQDPQHIKTPLTDEDQAYQECLEESGIDLKEMNVRVHSIDFVKSDGKRHLNLFGAKNNFVLQNVAFFFASIPKGMELPKPMAIDLNEGIEKGFWLKIKNIQINEDRTSTFPDPDTNMECSLSLVITKSLYDGLRDFALMQIKDAADDLTLKQIEDCKSDFPASSADINGWIDDEISIVSQKPVFIRRRELSKT